MNSNRSFSRFVIAATLTILSASNALAAEPDALIQAKAPPAASAVRKANVAPQTGEEMTVESANAKAQFYQRQAERYRSLGGVGYKTGLVQRAEADAANYAALAEALHSSAVGRPVRAPEAERFAQLAARYRSMGGVAYKAGFVQWAEAQQRKYEPTRVKEAPM